MIIYKIPDLTTNPCFTSKEFLLSVMNQSRPIGVTSTSRTLKANDHITALVPIGTVTDILKSSDTAQWGRILRLCEW